MSAGNKDGSLFYLCRKEWKKTKRKNVDSNNCFCTILNERWKIVRSRSGWLEKISNINNNNRKNDIVEIALFVVFLY